MSSKQATKLKQHGRSEKASHDKELSKDSKKHVKSKEKVEPLPPPVEASDESASETSQDQVILEAIAKTDTKKFKVLPLDAMELEIEKALFGSIGSFAPRQVDVEDSEQLSEEPEAHSDMEDDEERIVTHVLGTKADAESEDEHEDGMPPKKKAKKSETEEVAAAWTDDDESDEEVNLMQKKRTRKLRHNVDEEVVSGNAYQRRLREQRAKLQANATPSWAMAPTEDSDEETATKDISKTMGMLQSTAKLVSNKMAGNLQPGEISITIMADANREGQSNSVVQVVRWHPSGSLLMTAGLDKTMRLFDIDGVKNGKLQSVFFADLPIKCAEWSPSGNEVYLSGQRHWMYVYDVLSGKIDRIMNILGSQEMEYGQVLASPHSDALVVLGSKGRVYVLSQRTKAWVTTFKTSGAVRCALFDDEGRLWTGGAGGQIHVFDVQRCACLRRFTDEGSAPVTAMALSPSGEYLVTGQVSGIVNIYRTTEKNFQTSEAPKPIKTLYNLTTVITSIAFNHDSQLLAIASDYLRNQMRLVHIPSFTVFTNWPTQQTPIGRASSVAFSPDSHWLTIGNVRGGVKLFKIHHYHPDGVKTQ